MRRIWKNRGKEESERRKIEGRGRGNCIISHYLGERLHTGSSGADFGLQMGLVWPSQCFFLSIIESKFKNWEISHKKVRVLACLIKQEDMLTLAPFPPGSSLLELGRTAHFARGLQTLVCPNPHHSPIRPNTEAKSQLITHLLMNMNYSFIPCVIVLALPSF